MLQWLEPRWLSVNMKRVVIYFEETATGFDDRLNVWVNELLSWLLEWE